MGKQKWLAVAALVSILSSGCAAARGKSPSLLSAAADPVVAGEYVSAPQVRGASHPGRTGTLTAEERKIAEAAWRYFVNNTQAATGLVNAADAYPSTTMWDTGSAIGAIVAAQGLGLIDASDAEARLSRMLDTLGALRLYQGICPNKAYNTQTAAAVTYTNQPGEIGCSALDVARALYWMRIIQQRFPALVDKAAAAVAHWRPETLVREGRMFGTAPRADGGIDYLQEGRLGYEEYGAKAFRLWGFDTREAAKADPYGTITLYDVRLPFDARDPRVTGAHNYVVTESYVLDGIEYGWDDADDVTSGPFEHTSGWIARSANNVYLVQQRRFERTGILTARTEHQLAGAPYFVYDTVYSDGMPWATITDTGESHPDAAAVSTKGAIGLWVLWQTPYTDRLFDVVRGAVDPAKGIYEGVLEKDMSRIATFTANNNGIILESLLYKQDGKILRPDPAGLPPLRVSQSVLRRPSAAPATQSAVSLAQAAAPAPAVATPTPTVPSREATPDEKAMASIAWSYFVNNTQPDTGLVNAVDGYPSTTLWDAAAGVAAVVAADRFGLIPRDEALARLGKTLDTFGSVRLFSGICPNKVYDTRRATPANYSNQPAEIGCSALDVGRMLVWMKIVQNRYPELATRVTETVRHWKFSGLVRNGELFGVHARARSDPQYLQEGRLGYEEYSASGFALWGMDTARAASPEPFTTVRIEGVPIIHDRRSLSNEGGLNAVVTETFILHGIELGFGHDNARSMGSSWIKTQADNVVLAQQNRYERTGILTARTEHQLDRAPNFVYDSVFSEGTPFATQDVGGKSISWAAAVSTKAAIGIWTLWPGKYGQLLFEAVRKEFLEKRGFYEGVFENGGTIRALTANTNGILLETLLYRVEGPILDWSSTTQVR